MSIEKVELTNIRSSLYPVPVTLVSCEDNSRTNILTISWTGILCSSPPIIYISIRPDRFSYDLVKQSRRFIINIPSENQLEIADKCGNCSGRDVDKFKMFNLSKEYLVKNYPPLIKECKHHLLCDVIEIKEYGTHHAFIGQVSHEFINTDCLIDNSLDYSKINPIAYCRKDYMFLSESVAKYGQFKIK